MALCLLFYIECHYAYCYILKQHYCCYAEFRYAVVVMLNYFVLNSSILIPSVGMQSVIMPSDIGPFIGVAVIHFLPI